MNQRFVVYGTVSCISLSSTVIFFSTLSTTDVPRSVNSPDWRTMSRPVLPTVSSLGVDTTGTHMRAHDGVSQCGRSVGMQNTETRAGTKVRRKGEINKTQLSCWTRAPHKMLGCIHPVCVWRTVWRMNGRAGGPRSTGTHTHTHTIVGLLTPRLQHLTLVAMCFNERNYILILKIEFVSGVAQAPPDRKKYVHYTEYDTRRGARRLFVPAATL